MLAAAAGDQHRSAAAGDEPQRGAAPTARSSGGRGYQERLTPPDSATDFGVTAGAYHSAALRMTAQSSGRVRTCPSVRRARRADEHRRRRGGLLPHRGAAPTARSSMRGQNSARQCDVPPDLTNAVAVAAAVPTAALTADSAIIWNDGASARTSTPSLRPIALISAGAHHARLHEDGDVAAWGRTAQAGRRALLHRRHGRYLGAALTFSLATVGGRDFHRPAERRHRRRRPSDGDEVNVHGTDRMKDTDGDSLPDGWEVDNGEPLSRRAMTARTATRMTTG